MLMASLAHNSEAHEALLVWSLISVHLIGKDSKKFTKLIHFAGTGTSSVISGNGKRIRISAVPSFVALSPICERDQMNRTATSRPTFVFDQMP